MRLFETTALCELSGDRQGHFTGQGPSPHSLGSVSPASSPVTTQLPPCPRLGDNTILGDMPSPLYLFSPRAQPSPSSLPPRDQSDLSSVTLAWPVSLTLAHNLTSPCSDRVKWGEVMRSLLTTRVSLAHLGASHSSLHSVHAGPAGLTSPGKWGACLPEQRSSWQVPRCRRTPGPHLHFHCRLFGKALTSET